MSAPVPYRLCMKVYTRQVPWAEGVRMHCQSPENHEHLPCSWETVAKADEDALERLKDPEPSEDDDGAPAAISDLLADIFEGGWDAHLESILAVTHERKRSLRGNGTFERPRRRKR